MTDATKKAATLPVDVNASEWECMLEEGALRLGFTMVRGLGSGSA